MTDRRITLVSALAISFGAGFLGSHLSKAITPDLTAPATSTAHAWVSHMGILASGLSCDGDGRCTIVPTSGAPYAVLCDASTCRAEPCPR